MTVQIPFKTEEDNQLADSIFHGQENDFEADSKRFVEGSAYIWPLLWLSS